MIMYGNVSELLENIFRGQVRENASKVLHNRLEICCPGILTTEQRQQRAQKVIKYSMEKKI